MEVIYLKFSNLLKLIFYSNWIVMKVKNMNQTRV
jgi:hypothetical protein